MAFKVITYCYDKEDGIVYSRVGSELAIPVLDFESMKPDNGFEPTYNLERFNIYTQGIVWARLVWTKKIPVSLKNLHRAYWGFAPLKEG